MVGQILRRARPVPATLAAAPGRAPRPVLAIILLNSLALLLFLKLFRHNYRIPTPQYTPAHPVSNCYVTHFSGLALRHATYMYLFVIQRKPVTV